MRSAAFCPGHVTGFFEICRGRNMLSTGSRGAGFCTSLGATSRIAIKNSDRNSITVWINGKKSRAEVTRSALEYLTKDDKYSIEVRTKLDLPQSQGFGMSAAGALSSAFAAADVLGLSRQNAFEAAHVAEIENRAGLGDVSALHKGGITVRKRPGLPPVGEVMRIRGDPEMVLAVLGAPLLTRSVLSDSAKRRAINASGSEKVDQIVQKPSVSELFRLSAEFASETGLAKRNTMEAIGAASKLGMASMAMLGNSVFATGDTRGLRTVLSEFGKTWTCRVDTKGPRLL
jgi:pantoate kinase